MDTVEASTVVHLPPDEIYEFLLDFPRYAKYSAHLDDVTRDGDGLPGTRYSLTFSWWRLSYTARSEVTDVARPNRIDWRLVRDIDARGAWLVDPEPEAAPEDVSTASRVRLRINFAPDSATGLDLPAFVSLGWLVDRVKPKIESEARRVVRRVVADLEGEPRDVDLRVHTTPESV